MTLYAIVEFVVIAAAIGLSLNQVARHLTPGLHRRIWRLLGRKEGARAAAACDAGCSSGGCSSCSSSGQVAPPRSSTEKPLIFQPPQPRKPV
jgi:hypothetical protein